MPGPESLRDVRARAACEAVLGWGSKDKLKNEVKGLPVLVRSMGVAAAVALLESRTETRPLAQNLTDWLGAGHPGRILGTVTRGVSAFLQRFTALPSVKARALEEEGLRYAEALKLFAGGIHGP